MGKSGPETRLVTKMVKAAKQKYGERLVVTNNHGGLYSATGVSDLTGCLDGVFWACEVKAPESYPVKGQPSIEKALRIGPTVKQRLFVGRVLRAGGCAGFAASVDQFLALLEHAAWMSGDGGVGANDYCSGHNTEVDEDA